MSVVLVNEVKKYNSGRYVLQTWIKGQEHNGFWETDWYEFKTGKILGNCVNEALNKNMEKLYKLYQKGEFKVDSGKVEVEVNV